MAELSQWCCCPLRHVSLKRSVVERDVQRDSVPAEFPSLVVRAPIDTVGSLW